LYIPAEDSYLLAETVKTYSGEYALEIGVGTGIVLEKLCDSFAVVVGTDINYRSLMYCRNNLARAIYLVCCDAASALTGKFDLIVTNPPYIPQDNIRITDSAIYGGSSGFELALRFMTSSVSLLNGEGKMLTVLSDLSKTRRMISITDEMNLDVRVVKKKKIFFETLYVFEISKRV